MVLKPKGLKKPGSIRRVKARFIPRKKRTPFKDRPNVIGMGAIVKRIKNRGT